MLDQIKESIKNYDATIYGERKKSAVLLPLIEVDGEVHVLYEVRSQHVSQAGDSSFPGGRVEEGENFEEAAVRETMEELNLGRNNIKVIGEIDYIVNQHVRIHCFVGELTGVEASDIKPNLEVEQIYTIPLDYLLKNKPAYFKVGFDPIFEEQFLQELEREQKRYNLTNMKEKIPYYQIKTHSLWGFTANLTERLIQIIKTDIY